jgi:DNA mismatch endonuclease (patch repair protein)
MADVFTKEQRSNVMRKVKSNRNKSTELKLIAFFKETNIKGWRRTYKLFGKPDFTFPKHKITIFVDGCFWHGHDCRNTRPKDNADYWAKKRERNIKRDKEVTQTLENKGWTVIRIWECELKDEQILKTKIKRFFAAKPCMPPKYLPTIIKETISSS